MDEFSFYRRRGIGLILISVLALIGASGLFLRNAIFDTPIYASDEYAYQVSGKFYENRAAVYAADPGLQRLSNLLYFRIVQGAYAITKDGAGLLKLLNVLLYTLVGLAFAGTALYTVGRAASCCVLSLYFLLPWSGYLVSIQPEAIAYFGVICAGAAAVTAVHFRSRILCGMAGLVTAATCYIKPNAIGVAVGTALFFLFSFRQDSLRKARAIVRLEGFFAYLAPLYVGLVACPWILGERWSWMPTFASGDYAAQLETQSPGIARLAGLCLAYFGGHLAALALLFPVGICGLAMAMKRKKGQTDSSGNGARLASILARWVAWSGGVSLLFVAYYSAKIGQGGGFEAGRLHGRYIGFIFPFLLLFTFHLLFCPALGARATRFCRQRPLALASILLLGALAVWEVFGRRFLHIYPWDYPDLTVLYVSDNDSWHEPALWSFRFIFIVAAVATAACLALPKTWARYVAIAYLTLWIVVANRQNTAFQRITSQTLGTLTTEARTLTSMADLDHRGGVVVGSQRHGPLSYILFGLAARARVLVRPDGSTILERDLPVECEWVLCNGNFNPGFSYQSILQSEHLTLFLLQFGRGSPLMRDLQLIAQPITLDASKREAGFFGFNSSERWGSWSCLAEPFVQLPAGVRGALRVTLRVWTGAENAGKPLQLKIGGETHGVILTADPADYTIDFSSVELSNHLSFSFPVIQKHEWERPLGFALATVSVIPVNPSNQGPKTSAP